MNVNLVIDHTLLSPDASIDDIRLLCAQAKKYSFYSVCVAPSFVRIAKLLLRGTSIKVTTVISFPLGSGTPKSKGFDAKDAIDEGADEVFVVANISMEKALDQDFIRRETSSIKAAVGQHLLGVIIESRMLNKIQLVKAVQAIVVGGADMIVTGTGLAGNASLDDIALIRKCIGPKMGLKASTGMISKPIMEAAIKAGANRIGSIYGARIMEGK